MAAPIILPSFWTFNARINVPRAWRIAIAADRSESPTWEEDPDQRRGFWICRPGSSVFGYGLCHLGVSCGTLLSQFVKRRGVVTVKRTLVLVALVVTLVSGVSRAQEAPAFQSFSKFDFVPGEKIVAMEDFTQDSVGDFPAKWNTNASGEVVTLAGQSGRWLKLTKAGVFTPDFITELPENVTVEFDLLVRPGFTAGCALELGLTQMANRKNIVDWVDGTNVFNVSSFPGSGGGNESEGTSSVTTRQDGMDGAPSNTQTRQLAATGKIIHVALWRQRQRARVYFNEEKVWDLPRAVSASAKFNALVFSIGGGCGDCQYFLGSLRVATGAPDTRNKLVTEGKWVTRGGSCSIVAAIE